MKWNEYIIRHIVLNLLRKADEKISIREAFDYAVANDSYAQSKAQTPQIFSDINANDVFLK